VWREWRETAVSGCPDKSVMRREHGEEEEEEEKEREKCQVTHVLPSHDCKFQQGIHASGRA